MIEAPSRIEPTRLEEPGEKLADIIAELAAATAKLQSALHPRTAENLAGLVRLMNAYYSNLIEGHNTRPRDIERALAGHFDDNEERRNLQLEAKAHVRVQTQIDRMAADGTLPEPASRAFVSWLHSEFYRDAPPQALRVSTGRLQFTMEPGVFRTQPDQEVSVGRHTPPSAEYVSAFLDHFEQAYRLEPLGKGSRMIAMAAAHHRLNFIHPFLDGNGRVSRLMSHAMAHKAAIGANGLWSISRGLARGLASRNEYKMMMDYADTPRQGDLDGRGNLSERALRDFVIWFLRVALDQVTFMSQLFELDTLARRLRKVVDQSDRLKPETSRLLEEAWIRGEVDRGDASRVTGLPERSSRRIVADAIEAGLLGSDTAKGPLSLRFPVAYLDTLFPRLFPES